MQRLAVVTHFFLALRHAQAVGVERQDFGAGHRVGFEFRPARFQHKGHQEKRGSFGCVGIFHLLGFPLLGWAFRALSPPACDAVFGYCFAFRNYPPLRRCGLSAKAAA